MALPNVFTKDVTAQIIQRINTLTPETSAKWGKMNVSQMLAHCNVTYEMAYENKHKKPNAFVRFLLKMVVKNVVVTETPYKPNGSTAKQFIISDEREFEKEKARLIAYISQTQELGESHFEQKESHSFGVLNAIEWNNMFYKHLNHHLTQFGV
jgi:hypothetical protein